MRYGAGLVNGTTAPGPAEHPRSRRYSRRVRILALILAAGLALPAAAAHAATKTAAATTAATTITTATLAATTTQATVSESPVPVLESEIPPAGRRLSADEVLAIARKLPKMRAVQAEYPGSFADPYLKGPAHPARWQVSFFSKKGAKEIGQVIIADSSGKVLEQWTGFQVAWTMARGYPGAFGRHVNALYIWLALCVLFMLPFIDPRRPFSLLHLDLLVLLSFSVSLAFFNHANIYASVPLTYPPLIYLLARMLWLLRRGPRHSGARPGSEPRPLRLLIPAPWLALGVVFLLGFRIALNVTDSNVIDVGYAGVIGAEKIVHGDALYGKWPADNEHGDTYGPVTYESYVPFELLFGWSGKWDDLPAAHAAAIVFDLLALGLMFLLGRRIRGPTLGVALAYAWVAYPFTLFALESNSNDTFVAVLVLAALLFASSAPARGVFAALAGLAKFAPLALVPVLATHGLFTQPSGDDGGPGSEGDGEEGRGTLNVGRGEEGLGLEGGEEEGRGGSNVEGGEEERLLFRRERAHTRARGLATFCFAFALTVAIVSIPALRNDSLHTIFARTIEYQSTRGSPFSVWGVYGGLRPVQTAVQAAAVVLALTLAVIPRRPDVVGLAAACATILIAVQLGVEHWFYLYIPWFFPLVMIALLGARPPVRSGSPRAAGAADATPGWAEQPAAPLADGASGSARLRLPSAAWQRSG
jgi:hypothetical protein